MSDTAPVHDAAELTRYIESRYHARHREQLPALAKMSAKVQAVHSGDKNVPAGLSDLLSHLIGDMEVHMKKRN